LCNPIGTLLALALYRVGAKLYAVSTEQDLPNLCDTTQERLGKQLNNTKDTKMQSIKQTLIIICLIMATLATFLPAPVFAGAECLPGQEGVCPNPCAHCG
jgi:hypothetical protein